VDGGSSADAASATDLPPPEHGFQVATPEVTIAPGEEVTYCYYTSLPNTAEVGVKKWESKMASGSHHMIVYFSEAASEPDGTLDTTCAGMGQAVWTYAASKPDHHQDMPAGVGMTVGARQPAVIQMHYLNSGDAPIVARVTLNGHTYEDGAAYVKAAAYVTFNTQINVAPGQSGSVTGTCAVPAGAKFFTMSTHSHRFATLATISDGDAMLVETEDWEHPVIADWTDDPHFQFGAQLTYHCEYYNFSDAPVRTGNSAQSDEMCMAVGYFFPAQGPVFCLDSMVIGG
jgi:hypothetical protein